MVTAEFATALPAVVLVLALALGAGRYSIDQIRCVDAARAGARAAARGESPDVVGQVAKRGAPEGASVAISRSGGLVTVQVATTPSGLWPLSELPGLSASATAEDEQSIGETPR
ncbi:TadE family type IV pilus minor pilin [Austwickia chelonae]|uniref:TadE family type IV pilus minor pilin n=1 Tax=Austwickia chelonae TaxID=100225 RepID=UPI000E280F68|nr:TadE family type IV pilus minor pilin [Austwickia chelonae]